MIFRLSQKLAKKLKTSPPRPAPADPNPFADWSAHLFTADRTQYLILTNTPSLYSTVIYARGIPNDSQFLDRALSSIREFMVDDGQEFIFRRLIAPTTVSVRFASALNRSFTGSMNDLVYHAQTWLAKGLLTLARSSMKFRFHPSAIAIRGKYSRRLVLGNLGLKAAMRESSVPNRGSKNRGLVLGDPASAKISPTKTPATFVDRRPKIC